MKTSIFVFVWQALAAAVTAQAQPNAGGRPTPVWNAVSPLEFGIVIPHVICLRIDTSTVSAIALANRKQAVPWTTTVSDAGLIVYTAVLP